MNTPLAQLVYVLCALTSMLVSFLLWQSYRRAHYPLLFWSALCFVGFTVNNVLVFVDLVVLPQTDLAVVRTAPAVLGLTALVFGLIREAA